MGFLHFRSPLSRGALAVLTMAALAIPIVLASPAHASGDVHGVVTRPGGATIPLAADPSIGVKACANGSTSADCSTVAITSASPTGEWNLSLPGDAVYDLWVVNLGNTKVLGGPFDVFVPEGGTATAPPMEVEVGIVQATVETNQGTLFDANTAGVGACLSNEVVGPDCPSLRTQRDVDGNGTVTLALPPGTWNLRGFSESGAVFSDGTWPVTLATGDLAGPFPFTFVAPPPPASIMVEPHSSLSDGQEVVVYGTGFAPNETVSVFQCANVPPVGGNAPCDVNAAAHPVADGNGDFSQPFTVQNPMTSNVTTPQNEYDCFAVQCTVTGFQNGTFATQSLSFAQPTGTVSGTVRDTNGEPVPGSLVAACPVPGSPGPSCFTGLSSTNGAGDYTLTLTPGTYNVATVFGGGATAVRSPDAEVTIVTGQTIIQNFTLGLGKVSGSVLDGNGQPFPAGTAHFGACPAPGAALFCPGAQAFLADAAGNYSFRLAPGAYNVAGASNGFGTLSQFTPITIAVGQTIVCTVRMPDAPACGGDADGVPDAVEAGAPNGGDGNSDGIPDSKQANVTSLPNAVNGQYATLASPAGTTLANVAAIDPATLPPPPSAAQLPVGVFTFAVRGLAPGGAANVDVFLSLPSGTSIDSYFKFQNNTWQQFGGATIAGNHVTLALVDGGAGDGDGVANGVIVDPGAPGDLPPPVPKSKDDCKNGGWKNFVDDQGRPFKNQGDCVSFVSTKGKNKAKG